MLHSREGIILGSSAIPPANQGMGAPIFSAIHSNASWLSGFSRINDPWSSTVKSDMSYSRPKKMGQQLPLPRYGDQVLFMEVRLFDQQFCFGIIVPCKDSVIVGLSFFLAYIAITAIKNRAGLLSG